jgi:hypothetical protein
MSAAEQLESTTIRLSEERFDRAVQVADDVWLIATKHRPGYSQMQPEINNRCFVFRLRDHQKPVLLVANGVDPRHAVPEVKRIERETGLSVRYIVSPGGGHHLRLPEWRDAFEEATVLVGPEVAGKTTARKLLDGPRVSVMNPADPLPQFRGQLDAVLFDGLYGFPERQTPFEGGKESAFTMFKIMWAMMNLHTPADELWLHHAATDTVIAGENLGWIMSAKTIAGFPFMMRKMLKPDSVYVNEVARKVADPGKVAAHWREILAWPSRTLLGYHEPPGEGFIGDGRAALAAAVEAAKQLQP